MISRLPQAVTNNRLSSASLNHRIAPHGFGRFETNLPSQKTGNDHSPVVMGTLGHLACGCLGLTCVAAFMGVINIMVNMLFEQSVAVDLPSLLRIFGH